MSFGFLTELLPNLGNKEKFTGVSAEVVSVWIQFWVADLLRGLSLNSREECEQLCIAEWDNDDLAGEFYKGRKTHRGFRERANMIERLTEMCCKKVIKDKVSAAHLKSISGYGYQEIGKEIGCSADFAEELVSNRAGIIERLMKREA